LEQLPFSESNNHNSIKRVKQQLTMADLAAMRTYLRDVIGIIDPVERRQAVQDEGLAVLSDFVEFDKDGIETLCASVRKPGD
jgi:hypothetical protein